MRLIDILVATLLVFPWLAGDAEIRVPGVGMVELADLAPLLLVAILAAGAMLRASSENWHQRLIVRREWKLLGIAAAVLSGLAAFALLWRFWENEYPVFGPGDAVWMLTHGTGAVVLVALTTVAVRRWSPEPWERSVFARQLMKLGRAWRTAVERWPNPILWGTAAIVGAGFFGISSLRHQAFETHGFDLGIFTNVLWNLSHGYGYVSSMKGGINLFVDHQSPLLWALAPLFWLFPRPETLLFAQAFGLAAGGPALFHIGRAHFGREHWVPTALPWLYWGYLPLRNANAFDFHPEVFMLPLFLWAFAAFAARRDWVRGLGLLALVAALGTKESAAIVAVGIGIALAVSRAEPYGRRSWPGLALAAAGLALFLFDVKVVPRWLGGDYAYLGFYERFGGGIVDVVLAPFTQPVYFFSQILDRARLNFLFWTLAPLGFLPLFNWRTALAVMPPYLALFLSEGDQRVRLVFHYGIEPGSALFWALPFGIAAFARRFGWRRAGMWMLFWAVVSHGETEVNRARSFDKYLNANWLATTVVPCLNPQAPTAASDSLVPHLATRHWISYLDQLAQKPSGDPVQCVVTDLSVDNWPVGKQGTRRVLAELPNRGYRQIWKCNDFSVYALGTAACLRCVPACY